MKAEKARNGLKGCRNCKPYENEGQKSCLICVEYNQFRFNPEIEKLLDLEAKAAKWDMIQWAIDSEVEFVEIEDGGDFEIALYSQDIDRLEELYKERETNG